MILAIDTSIAEGGVALSEDETVRAEIVWQARSGHSRRLASAIEELFVLAEIHQSNLTAVVVAIGPGSFNGLRVGLSAGKGIALALNIPMIGISTLDVIGFQASSSSSTVWAAVPAGRGEVAIASYQGGAMWKRTGPYERLLVDRAVQKCTRGDTVAGPAAEELYAAARAKGIGVQRQEALWNLRRPSFLAELGRRYLAAGGVDQLDSVQPLYLRRSSAEETRAAAHQE